MAITDISISEELMTNAPSIKYRGEEGVITYMLSDEIEVVDDGYSVKQKQFKTVDLTAKLVLHNANLIKYRCFCYDIVSPDATMCSGNNSDGKRHKLRRDHQRYDRNGEPDMLRAISGTGLNFILKPDANQAWTIALSLLEEVADSAEDRPHENIDHEKVISRIDELPALMERHMAGLPHLSQASKERT